MGRVLSRVMYLDSWAVIGLVLLLVSTWYWGFLWGRDDVRHLREQLDIAYMRIDRMIREQSRRLP